MPSYRKEFVGVVVKCTVEGESYLLVGTDKRNTGPWTFPGGHVDLEDGPLGAQEVSELDSDAHHRTGLSTF